MNSIINSMRKLVVCIVLITGISIHSATDVTTSVITLQGCDSYCIRSSQTLESFAKKLCARLNVSWDRSKFMLSHNTDQSSGGGYTIAQFMSQGAILGHVTNKTNALRLAIISSISYASDDIAQFSKEFFKARSYKIQSQS